MDSSDSSDPIPNSDIENASLRIRDLEEEIARLKNAHPEMNEQLAIFEDDEVSILEATVESSIVPTFVLDQDGNFLLTNKAFTRHFLAEIKSTEKAGLKHAFPLAVRRQIKKLTNKILNGASSNSFDWECDNDLDPQIFNLSLFPIFGKNSKRFAVGCVVVDITEKTLFERKLITSESRLRTMVEKTDNLVIQLDPGYSLIFANKAALEVYGLSSNHYKGLNSLGFVHVEDVDRVERALDEAVAAGKNNLSIEYRFPPNRGDIEYLLWSFQLIYNDSRDLLYINGIGRDISKRRSLELALTKAKDTAEAADRSKSEFLAMISHEIRTPLNSIIGLSDLLKDLIRDDEQSLMLKTISSSGQSLLSLINDVLDLSKVESGHISLEDGEVVIRDCLSQLENLFLFRANSKQLDFSISVDENVPKFINTDEDRLLQVLNNLVGNAIKFTAEGSVVVRVRAELLTNIEEFDFSTPEDEGGSKSYRIIFEIEDTGIGISPEQRVLLFQPFSQADPSIRRRFGGTGLGLVVSRKLAKLMGGDIDLTSSLGRGSVFSFTLEAEGRDQQQIPDSKPTKHASTDEEDASETLADKYPLRIMVVDDISQNRLVMSLLLERMGYEPAILSSGAEALEYLKHNEIDLLFLDMLMPEMSGTEVCRKIRASLGSSKIRSRWMRIVALTANVMNQDKEECLKAGMDDFLGKPIRFTAIQSTIVQTYDEVQKRAEDELGLWDTLNVVEQR